jgi:SPP1 family predicted phage head-tail adaptor
VRGGDLRHLIRVEQKTIDVSGDGDRTETWTTFAEVWASVETGNGREFFAARQVIADLTHTIRMRYVMNITPDMRIAYDDQKTGRTRYFDIKSILNPDERDEMLTLQATEVLI